MIDFLTSEQRSAFMARIRRKDTSPERAVRRLLHRLGYRYRLHHPDLPGCPDIVFTRRRLAIFVHGCFWHAHEDCRRARIPKTRSDYWKAKFQRNKARDERDQKSLRELGWKPYVIWECETGDVEFLEALFRGIIGKTKV